MNWFLLRTVPGGVFAIFLLASGTQEARAGNQSFAVALPEMEGPVTMAIFSETGERVRLLYRDADVASIPSGLNGLIMTWDGKDDACREVPPGTYRARGLVHGPLVISALPLRQSSGRTFSVHPMPDMERPPIGLPVFPKHAITLRAARDALMETPPLLTILAMIEGNGCLLSAGGLPLVSIPLPDPKCIPEGISLIHGGNPGTASLIIDDRDGRAVITITGLDRIVPVDAGPLTIQPDAFHPDPVAGESAP